MRILLLVVVLYKFAYHKINQFSGALEVPHVLRPQVNVAMHLAGLIGCTVSKLDPCYRPILVWPLLNSVAQPQASPGSGIIVHLEAGVKCEAAAEREN